MSILNLLFYILHAFLFACENYNAQVSINQSTLVFKSYVIKCKNNFLDKIYVPFCFTVFYISFKL